MTSMTEVAFARQFLSALDSRAVKLSSDHVADPRQYPAQGPYLLPKLSSQPQKRKRDVAAAAPGAERVASTLQVALKNSKSPSASYTLEPQPLTASIYDLKSIYAAKSGAAVDKIKLLYNKKPTQDSKTLKDLLGDEAESTKDVELGVMVMGGLPTASPAVEPAPESSTVPAAQGVSGADVLKDGAFWSDLKGFLQQRIRDEAEAERLSKLFHGAWQNESIG